MTSDFKLALARTVVDLRAADMFAFDHSARKLAIFENTEGQVVMLSLDDGNWQPCVIEIGEVDRVIELLQIAKREAQVVENKLMTERVGA